MSKTPEMIQLEHRIAKLSQSRKMLDFAKNTVGKKLGSFLVTNEIKQIAEDALSETVINTLRRLPKPGKSTPTPDSTDSHIDAYIKVGIQNYCNTRARRWSNANEQGKFGARARQADSGQREEGDPEDFWDNFASTASDIDSIDHGKVDELLADMGIDTDKIGIIKEYLAGYTYTDLAKKYGDTPDKYRKMINRALDQGDLGEVLD